MLELAKVLLTSFSFNIMKQTPEITDSLYQQDACITYQYGIMMEFLTRYKIAGIIVFV